MQPGTAEAATVNPRGRGAAGEQLRLQQLFMDILHHDLSNPLNAARSASILLGDQPSLAADLIPLIQRNIAKAQEIIDNARRYTQLGAGERLDQVEIDLGDLLRGVVTRLAGAAAEAGMTVELALEGPLPVRAGVIAEEIFTNLLSNALKYAAAGKRVLVEGQREGAGCRVSVRDFGPGIDNAYKTTIFDRFSRRDKAGVKGSGLGLAIARRITELLGGTIAAEDNPGGGALFTVFLPCSPPASERSTALAASK